MYNSLKRTLIMKNLFYLCFILLLTLLGCTTRYRSTNNQAYLTDEHRNKYDVHKFYQNDSLNLTLEINWGSTDLLSLGLQNKIDKSRSHILSLTHVNHKKDLLLYTGHRIFVILKKSKINLSSFVPYNVEDPVTQYSWDKTDKLIYRKTIVDRRKKIIIVNDMIPFRNDYLSIVQYVKSEEEKSPILKLKNPDYLYVYSEWYRSILKISKLNAHNINIQKRYINTDPFILLDQNFKAEQYNNYRTTVLAATKSQQYRKKEEKQLYDRVLATYYSFAHEQRKSDSLWALLTHHTRDTTFNQEGTIDDLLKRADSTQIVMFNEIQNCPQHRYLVGTLLEKFYKKGFRYLGLESFTNDSSFIKKGYPTSENGFLMRDPVMANMVRAAHKIGFNIFGYDSKHDNTRDVDQAKNIYDKTFSKDPKAKVLILAENDRVDKKNMAGKLEALTAITPLTIDQSYTYLHHLNNENKKDEAYIIQDKGLTNKPNVDFMLWNDLVIKNNCFSLQETKPLKINIPDSISAKTTIVCIYNKTELIDLNKPSTIAVPAGYVKLVSFNNANKITPIPVGLHVITNREKTIEFFLCPGKYMIYYYNDDGNVLGEESRSI